nr:unnamed protein product [Callosobruchus analis]
MRCILIRKTLKALKLP